MLSEKIPKGRLAKTLVEPFRALKEAGTEGEILSMDASWHRTMDGGKESVEMASFAFLLARDGKPVQVEVEYENGWFTDKKVTDVSAEIGGVEDEEDILKKIRMVSDAEILEKLEASQRVKDAVKRAKHLRVSSLSFVLFDEEYEAPVWHAVLKNWPLTNFFKREKPMTVEATIEAVRGNVLSVRKVI